MASSNNPSPSKEHRLPSDLLEDNHDHAPATSADHDHRPSISSDPGATEPRSREFFLPQTPTLTMDQVMAMMRENTQMLLEEQGQRMAKQMSEVVAQFQDSLRTYARGPVETGVPPDSTQPQPQTTFAHIPRPDTTTFMNYRERPTIEEDDDGIQGSSRSSLGSALGPADQSQYHREPAPRTTPMEPRNSDDRFRDSTQRWEHRAPGLPSNLGPVVQADTRVTAPVDDDKSLERMIQAAQKIKKYDGPTFDCVPKKGKDPTMFIDDWLIEFDRWFKICVGDPNTVGLLRSCIQVLGRAVASERDVFDWLNTRMEDEPFFTWTEVHLALSGLLMPESERMRRGTLQVVFDCIQGDTSIALYTTRFNKCVKMYNLYRAKTSSSDSLSIAHSFYRGIKDPDMRDQIWLRCKQDVSNLSSVQKIASLVERDGTRQNVILKQGTLKPSPEIETTPTVSRPASTTTPFSTPNTTSPKSGVPIVTVDSLARDMQALRLFVGQRADSQDARPNGYHGGPTPTRDMSKIQCYNCQQYGHYSGKCPEAPTAKTIVARNRFSAMVVQMSSPEEETEPLLSSHDVWFTKTDMQDFIDEQVSMVEIAKEGLNDGSDFHQG